MKLSFVVSLICAVVALTRTDRIEDSLIDTSGIGSVVPQQPQEDVKEARPFGDVQNDGIIDDPEEDYLLQVENDLDDESSPRSKRAVSCGGAVLQEKVNRGEGCSSADCTNRAEMIQQDMLSRLEDLNNLFAYKKAMLQEKLTSHLKASLGARIAAGYGLDASCCPDLPCCSTDKNEK